MLVFKNRSIAIDIEGLSVESVHSKATISKVGRGIVGMHVDIDGIDGADFVACASDDLIDEILIALGETRCLEHFGIDANLD